MIDKQQIERIKSMLQSDNIDDINLAGNLIKTQVLKINDEQLEIFAELLKSVRVDDYSDLNYDKIIQLLKSEKKPWMAYKSWQHHINNSYNHYGLKDINRCGELILNNE